MQATLLVLLCLTPSAATDALAQDPPEDPRSERVTFSSPVDSMPLNGMLALPAGEGPFPGVVLLSLAGVSQMMDRLTGLGWAVLQPERRGLATVEHLLRASFDDLAQDVAAAKRYLRTRVEVDSTLVGLIAQGGETMAGVLASVELPPPVFVVLMAPPGLPGDEGFWIEQRRVAEARGYDARDLDALDVYLRRLTDIVATEPSPGLRAFRVRALNGEFEVEPPMNAAFPPNPEDQIRFYASRWWRDLFLFEPEKVFARITSPVLVLMGSEDVFLPYQAHLPAIERGLAAASTPDVTVCVLPDLMQHHVSPRTLDLLEGWLTARLTANGFEPSPGDPPDRCLDTTQD